MNSAPKEGGLRLQSPFGPRGDQPRAIEEITHAFHGGVDKQTLLGVTGSGKTFTMAHVAQDLGLPTLVIAHNKTLAAQLYDEFRQLFPSNAVEYFVSYYDYYQPEAYVPSTDTYIDKDSTINDAIDRMRHSATRALFERRDVIIVASVSCIYGLGSAEAYRDQLIFLEVGQQVERDAVMRRLVDIQYKRNELDFHRSTFRARGDVLEIFPAHEEAQAVRASWFGDTLESLELVDPLRGQARQSVNKVAIYPSTHYVTTEVTREQAIKTIRHELRERLVALRGANQLVEAQRLEQRTMFDLEMMEQMGFCNGIENYSRHLTGRQSGQPPPTLVDYFPRDFLMVLDESHQTVPQLAAMYRGDRARKQTLVDYGFRLPSALDNRPLRFEELQPMMRRVLFVSATPGEYELGACQGVVVEQIIRPTGLVDPEVEVRPARTQVDDLLGEVRATVAQKERVLVTTLTKRMAEDLTEYFGEVGVKVRYLHADIDTLERLDILRDLRRGVFDVLVGINLLREGLDLPEVRLVAILDADKEGFLRSERSLIQTMGRAARNVHGRVILYGDSTTESMRRAMDESQRRRERQLAHNRAHNITPVSTTRAIREMAPALIDAPAEVAQGEGRGTPQVAPRPKGRGRRTSREERTTGERAAARPRGRGARTQAVADVGERLIELETQMRAAATELDFERAAELRDEIAELRGREAPPEGGAPR